MPEKKPFIKSHYEVWAGWFVHGGPHILWMAGVLSGLYSFGVIDVPAWSKDVKAVSEQVAVIGKKQAITSVKLSEIKIENSAARERDLSQQRQLDDISNKLDILINRAVSGNSRQ